MPNDFLEQFMHGDWIRQERWKVWSNFARSDYLYAYAIYKLSSSRKFDKIEFFTLTTFLKLK